MAKRHAYHKKLLALLVIGCVLPLLLGRRFADMTTKQDRSAQPAVMQSIAAQPALRPLAKASQAVADATLPSGEHFPSHPTSSIAPAAADAATPPKESLFSQLIANKKLFLMQDADIGYFPVN